MASRLVVLPSVTGRPELRLLRKPPHQGLIRRRWFALFTLVVVGVGMTWAVNAYRQQAVLLYQLQHEAAGLNDELAQARARQTNLEQQKELQQTDPYIEMRARELFGLVKPGETPFTTRAPER